MTLEFLRAHTGKDGKRYIIGQLADIPDADAQELIRQGVAKQQQPKAGGESQPETEKEK